MNSADRAEEKKWCCGMDVSEFQMLKSYLIRRKVDSPDALVILQRLSYRVNTVPSVVVFQIYLVQAVPKSLLSPLSCVFVDKGKRCFEIVRTSAGIAPGHNLPPLQRHTLSQFPVKCRTTIANTSVKDKRPSRARNDGEKKVWYKTKPGVLDEYGSKRVLCF